MTRLLHNLLLTLYLTNVFANGNLEPAALERSLADCGKALSQSSYRRGESSSSEKNALQCPPLEPIPKAELNIPEKYPYFTLGSYLVLQQVGVGQRYRNVKSLKGHDIGLNAYVPLLFFASRDASILSYKYPIFPSVKYTYLKYKNNTPTAPYFGVACEGIFIIDKSQYYRSFSQSVHLIPNVGLIWGRERENIRFTQLQVNVIPAIGLVVGTGFLLFGSGKGGFLSARDLGLLCTLGSTAVLCSYSAGF